MRFVSILTAALIMAVVTPVALLAQDAASQTLAGPTNAEDATPSAERRAQQAEVAAQQALLGASSLFDGVGLPLLRLSAPLYIQLGERGKVRSLGQGESLGSGAGNSVGSSIGNVVPAFNPGTAAPLPGISQVPEAASLFLMAPALMFAVRRLARSTRGSRSPAL